jgi:hypothetical protein
MEIYLEQCKKLSLTARAAIALLVFERFCEENQIKLDQVRELSDYLWQWPLVDGPDQFEPWESSRTELVNYGLGDEASPEVLFSLEEAKIDEFRFRNIVNGLVEILWGSFWGAAENELSLKALSTVLSSSKLEKLPTITPFKFSLYSDMGGWGEKITKEDRDFWRRSYTNA